MHNAGILLGGHSSNQQYNFSQLQFSTVRLLCLAGHFDSSLAIRKYFFDNIRLVGHFSSFWEVYKWH